MNSCPLETYIMELISLAVKNYIKYMAVRL